eukprot:scaffold5860_cov223-Amphora_coffeaeformis.AAC.10
MSNPPQDVLTSCLEAVSKTMLSVGSGDGSQQKALVERGIIHLHVTFYDSKQQLLRKYPHAAETLEYLEKHCSEPPKYQVDATQLDEIYPPISFDLVFFTFPHTGVSNNDRSKNIETNQTLLRGFLLAASKVVKPTGEVQVTLKTGHHYEQWKLPDMLERSMGLKLRSRHKFDPSMFPGYHHRLTVGMQGNLKVVPDKGGARVFVFEPAAAQREGTASPAPLFAGKWLTIVSSPRGGYAWTDEEVQACLVERMSSSSAIPRDVLELRRTFDEPIPDTRQLNRVLYAMEKSKITKRHPPGNSKKNKKPRFSLNDESS